jgi:hypothetical protein
MIGSRRLWLSCTVAGLIAVVPGIALAGTYLDRVVLLVREASHEADYLQYRLNNRELARMIHTLAVARLEAARDTEVPKEVTLAHPHLLLMLENYERASAAAVEGEAQRFVVYQRRARDEEQIFRSILRQRGVPLPDEKKRAGVRHQ